MKPHQQVLIGKKASITQANNQELVGKTGIITNETKHTITIDNKIIPKNKITITIDNQAIKGEHINKTIPERIKVHKQ